MESKGPLVGRIQEALAEDDRTNALDIQIHAAGGKIFLIGTVGSHELRAAVEEVALEITTSHGIALVNDLRVVELVEGTGEESVPT
jgi:osmotically-inducible protein OsmY